ncbi:MAG: NADH-quinone oxidoreductase subunit C [Deltaproteobacteria bacterium]|nr:NADH-quinone oxidoreductase subunit C [Deltaproteobacteria bacterium]
MVPQEIFEKLRRELGEQVVTDLHDGAGPDKDPWLAVEPPQIQAVCAHLKRDPELGFDYLECLTGIDLPEDGKIQVVYHVYSYRQKHRIVVKTLLAREDPVIPTVTGIWSAANWQERECFDLLGVVFDGHPDLRRLLLPEDWEGHPLRKDWREGEQYHGIPTTRPNTLELLGAKAPGEQAAGADEA